MSDLNTTIIDIFNDWFLKQHGLLPEQAIQRIAELEAENKRFRKALDSLSPRELTAASAAALKQEQGDE